MTVTNHRTGTHLSEPIDSLSAAGQSQRQIECVYHLTQQIGHCEHAEGLRPSIPTSCPPHPSKAAVEEDGMEIALVIAKHSRARLGNRMSQDTSFTNVKKRFSPTTLMPVERVHVLRTLNHAGQKQPAADLPGINRSTIDRQYGSSKFGESICRPDRNTNSPPNPSGDLP